MLDAVDDGGDPVGQIGGELVEVADDRREGQDEEDSERESENEANGEEDVTADGCFGLVRLRWGLGVRGRLLELLVGCMFSVHPAA